MQEEVGDARAQRVSPGAASEGSRQICILLDEDAGFRTLFLNNPQAMWVYDAQTLQFLAVNDAATQHYGYSRAEFLQMKISEIHPVEGIARLEEYVTCTRSEERSRSEWRHRAKDGSLIDVEVIRRNVTFRGREAKLASLRDITKEKKAEEALRAAERKYRLIFEEALIGLYQSTPDGRILSVNPAMGRMYGVNTPEEFVSYITDVQTQVYVEPARRTEYKRLMAEHGGVRNFEVQVYRRDGTKMWLAVNGRAVLEGEIIVRYEGSAEDISERKNLEDQLRLAQEQHRQIFESAVGGIFQSTPEGRYIKVNPAMAKMLGYDSPQDLIENITDINRQVYVDPKQREEIRSLTRQGVVKDLECEVYRKDGSKMWISAYVRAIFEGGVVVRYEGMNTDITQRKLLEDQLRQAQKMEAVGQLAGGVAHDFNNALAVITGYSDLLQMSLPADSPSHRQAEEIAKAGRRAAGLTRQLLAFSRKQVIQPVVLDLNAATHELEKMLRRLIGEHIEISFKRSPGLGRVKMDPGQVEQVLMNLCVNARDAMPEGGRLCVETANVELDDVYARQHAFVVPGYYVMLSVSDTGCGMSPETQRRIYEPFFTTKDPGRGTGLGLSTVYGIAKQNNGYIIAYSEVEKGTTFRLYLPRLEQGATITETDPVSQEVAYGTETVMVVEDEEALRTLVRTCLESNGYQVLDAPDAATALQMAEKNGRNIDLLLTDMVMPGMGGRDLANRMLVLHPNAKVLFMSGYSNDLLNQQRTFEPGTELLEKPFTLLALLSKVGKVLHGAESGKAAGARSGE